MHYIPHIERLHERSTQSVLFLPTDLSMRAECTVPAVAVEAQRIVLPSVQGAGDVGLVDQLRIRASGQGRHVLYHCQWLMPAAVVGAEPSASGVTKIQR